MAGKKSGAICAVMKDGAKLAKQLQTYDRKAENVLKRSVSDVRSRAPSWISMGARKIYNVDKGTINRAGPRAKSGTTIQIAGREVAGVTLVYKDRMLTTPRFSQSPVERPSKLPYQIHVKILNGKRANLPPDAFLAKKLGALPFQRKGEDRKPLLIIKAIAVPEMIGSERASETISEAVYERMKKRVENHIKTAFK